jgi:V8-like Glu-specific endopeptidase
MPDYKSKIVELIDKLGPKYLPRLYNIYNKIIKSSEKPFFNYTFGIIYDSKDVAKPDDVVEPIVFEAMHKYPAMFKGFESSKSIYSAGILVDKESLSKIRDTEYYKLKTISFAEKVKIVYKNKINLYVDQRYYTEPTVVNSLGSCFAIRADLIVTCKHVVSVYEDNNKNKSYKDMVVVFNYNNNYGNLNIHRDNIFSVIDIHNDTYSNNEIDFIILKVVAYDKNTLSESIPNEFIATYETNHNDFKKWNLFMCGYPYGMPMKIANKGKIKQIDYGYYQTDLDSFQYNSGSPVFNQEHNVIGIIDSGSDDFAENKIDKSQYDPLSNKVTQILPIKYIIEKIKI